MHTNLKYLSKIAYCLYILSHTVAMAACVDTKSSLTAATAEELEKYLSSPILPEKVQELVNQGRSVYQNANSDIAQQRKQAKELYEFDPNSTAGTGGGRSYDWIADTFSKSEQEIIKDLLLVEAPKTWTIRAINQLYEEARRIALPADGDEKPTITLVKKVGINFLHEYPLGQNAVVQLASQFNYLESPGTHKVPVKNYLGDKTQGPQGSIEAAAAALHRLAAEKAGNLPHALHRILPKGHHHFYENGYLMQYQMSSSETESFNESLSQNIENLEILPQWAMCEPTGAWQLQVFAAAPSFQGASTPKEGSEGEKLCAILVAAQYEAIAKLAVIMSVKMNKVVPLHLTMVGQGAFRNPPSVIKVALAKVAAVIKGYPRVQVYIHAFTDKGEETVRAAQDDSLFVLVEKDKQWFHTAVH